MAYAFMDNKSKSPIVLIEGETDTINTNGLRSITINSDELLNTYGISNISDYVVIANKYSTVGETVGAYWMDASADGNTFVHAIPYDQYGSLIISAKNGNDSARPLKYRIVLMKVK